MWFHLEEIPQTGEYRDRKYKRRCQGRGKEVTAVVSGSFGARVTKMFWNQVTRIAVQHCDYSENHWIVHFKERALRYVNYTATFENQWIRSRVCRLPFFGHGGTQRTGCVSLVGMRHQSTTPQFCCVSEHTEKSGNHRLHAGIGMCGTDALHSSSGQWKTWFSLTLQQLRMNEVEPSEIRNSKDFKTPLSPPLYWDLKF